MGRTSNSDSDDVSNISKECTDKVRTRLINTAYDGNVHVDVDVNVHSHDKDKYGDKDEDKNGDGNKDRCQYNDNVARNMKDKKDDQGKGIKYSVNEHASDVSVPLTGAILADDMGTGKVRI